MNRRTLRSSLLLRQLGDWRAPGGGPGYRQLADRIRLLVLDGRLPLETALPGERELAAALQVGRNLVAAAYATLRDEGFLTVRRGAGVSTRLPDGPGPRGPALISVAEPESGVLDLAAAVLPAGAEVYAAYARALERLPKALPGHGYEPVGAAGLRAVLAERYSRAGLPTTADQIMVTHGAQNALALLLRWRTRPADRVVIEHPTYPHAIDAITTALCRPIPVGLTADGWDIEALVDRIVGSGARLAYLIPDHQNPTGRSMPAAERARLISGTARSDALLVFDETLADLWLDEPPDRGDPQPDGPHILRLGSMSKSYWGGLRVGWIRGDATIVAALGQARASMDLGVAVLEQLAAAELLAGPDGPLAERRRLLAARREAALDRLADRLPQWRAARPPGGLCLWVELPWPGSSRLAAEAERRGVRIAAGPRFGTGGTLERFIRLPFTLPEDAMTAAIDLLADAWGDLKPSKPADAAPARREAAVF